MIKKPPKRRFSSQYREFIRARIDSGKERCPICGEPATEGHHEGPSGMGRKPDDFLLVPICKRCHRMRHDAGITAWLDLYRHHNGDDTTMADVHWIIAVTQHSLLLDFCTEMDPELSADGLDPRKTFAEIILDQIAWIEANHPDWIQDRHKKTSLGRRKPNKRGGCRPLTKKIG